jgi:hypothetical protein
MFFSSLNLSLVQTKNQLLPVGWLFLMKVVLVLNVPIVLAQMLDEIGLRHQTEMNRRRIPRL